MGDDKIPQISCGMPMVPDPEAFEPPYTPDAGRVRVLGNLTTKQLDQWIRGYPGLKVTLLQPK